jgi:hypothetical protein
VIGSIFFAKPINCSEIGEADSLIPVPPAIAIVERNRVIVDQNRAIVDRNRVIVDRYRSLVERNKALEIGDRAHSTDRVRRSRGPAHPVQRSGGTNRRVGQRTR